MNSEILDYELPPECIAQFPSQRRDESRLLVVERESGKITHAVFRDLPDILPRGFDIFRNNAAVLKARIFARRENGARMECLLLSPKTPKVWTCMLRPGKKLKTGASFGLDGIFTARVLEKNPDGSALAEFFIDGGGDVLELSQKIGLAPLPPYIRRTQDSADYDRRFDNERYETVYADPQKRLAAAAPTAGMHFTQELNAELERRSHKFFDVTLHVGIGTFQPLKCAELEEHRMHSETYEIPPESQRALLDESAKRLAVGTTSVRAMEDWLRKRPHSQGAEGKTYLGSAQLFIYPPQKILSADALLTNFHLPRSTLLCLVSAFLSPEDESAVEKLKEIYALAISKGYRFFSYGDAMLIL